MRRYFLLLSCLLLCAAATAASFTTRFDQANALLQSGDATAAIERYREMLIDYPDSDVLRYAVASAHHRAGQNSAAQGAREGAAKEFEIAKGAFEELAAASDADIRAEAAFGAADTLVQAAQLNEYDAAATAPAGQAITPANAAAPMGSPDNYKVAVEGWRAAVQALESVVREYPAMNRAQRNLDAARYRLKKLLQNPPEDQENGEEEQDQEPPEDDQRKVSRFGVPTTDLENADTKTISENTVRLERLDAKGDVR